MKVRKKPIVVDAVQWLKDGDHYKVTMCDPVQAELTCIHCGFYLKQHGWIDTLEGGHRVCPGDWIITGVRGEHYPCKNDIFVETYERVTR